MALTQFGEPTRTLILKHESHKLHHEFEVGEDVTVRKGQPCVLTADGSVVPLGTDGAGTTVIGYSLHNGGAGQLVTLMMRPFLIVWAQVNGAVDAGPVSYDGQNNTDPEFPSFAAVAAEGVATGFALDPAEGADDVIRVALI